MCYLYFVISTLQNRVFLQVLNSDIYQIFKEGVYCIRFILHPLRIVCRCSDHDVKRRKKRRSERFVIWCWHCIQTGRKTLIFALCRSSVRCMVHLYIIGVICSLRVLFGIASAFAGSSLEVLFVQVLTITRYKE